MEYRPVVALYIVRCYLGVNPGSRFFYSARLRSSNPFAPAASYRFFHREKVFRYQSIHFSRCLSSVVE